MLELLVLFLENMPNYFIILVPMKQTYLIFTILKLIYAKQKAEFTFYKKTKNCNNKLFSMYLSTELTF